MYSRSGGKQGMDGWIASANTITEISYIIVQLYWHNQQENSPNYSSFSELWNLSNTYQSCPNKRFASLPSNLILCLLRASWDSHATRWLELHGDANTTFHLVMRNLASILLAVQEFSRWGKGCARGILNGIEEDEDDRQD